MGTQLPTPKKGQSLAAPSFGHVNCGRTAGWTEMLLATEVGLGPGHIVLDGDPATPSKKGDSPPFSPTSVEAKRLDGSRCHLLCRWASAWPRPHFYMGTQLSHRKGHSSPQFRGLWTQACVRINRGPCYWGKTAGWTRIALGTEVGLSPGDTVLHGDPGFVKRAHQSSNSSAHV